jgi:hypothetical protein
VRWRGITAIAEQRGACIVVDDPYHHYFALITQLGNGATPSSFFHHSSNVFVDLSAGSRDGLLAHRRRAQRSAGSGVRIGAHCA